MMKTDLWEEFLPDAKGIVTGLTGIFGVYLLARYNYLFFHSVTEGVAIVIAILIYILGTKTYKYSRDDFLFFLGIAYFYIAVLDFLHLFTYKGMGVFSDNDPDLATQLWIVGRYLEALTLFCAPLFLQRKTKRWLISGTFLVVTATIITSIFYWDIFPACYESGSGLTNFKVISEYVICGLIFGGMYQINRRREGFAPMVFQIMLLSMVLTILSEFSFTLYLGVQDFMNFLGHLLKIGSYLLIFKGIILQGIDKPYAIIFKELKESNTELEMLNEKKNQFLGMAAHDLRNPLSLIMMYSKFLVDGSADEMDEKQLKYLHRIRGSSEYMLKLVEDLLDISQIEAGKLNLELLPTDIVAVVQNNLAYNQPLAWEKDIELIFNYEHNLPRVMVDPLKLEQVLTNLISNAIKFSFPHTRVEIKVYTHHDQVVILIQDQGQGIPEDEMERIFTPFDKTSTQGTGGEKSTGLGLVITRKIVEGHQGQIWVESEVGHGSKFYVALPINGETEQIETTFALPY